MIIRIKLTPILQKTQSLVRRVPRYAHEIQTFPWAKRVIKQLAPLQKLLVRMSLCVRIQRSALKRLRFPINKKLVKRYPFLENLYLRVGMTLSATVIVLAEIIAVVQPYFSQHVYALGAAGSLLTPVNQPMADELKYDSVKQKYTFNDGNHAPIPNLIGSAGNQVSATAYSDASRGISVTDPINKVSFTMTPSFGLWQGKQDGNRIVYPLTSGVGWAVYTMHSIGVKEDVLLDRASGNTMTLDYTLGLGDGLQARTETDGSIGIYGNTLFSSNIPTSTAKDAALLKKARLNAPKNSLLFRIPAPTVTQLDKKQSSVKASYALRGNDLKVKVTGLKRGHYPLTVDPSVYVTSAQQFMAGNNETNIDFDVADGLIEKGQTTGARFDSWNSTKALSTSVWQQGVAVAGGYIYTVGGIHSNGASVSYTTVGNSTFTVPSGITSITVKAWGAGGGGGGGGTSGSGGTGGGGGFAETTLTVTPGETLNVTVGGGGGQGNFSSGGSGNYSGDGGGGGGYSDVARSSTPLIIAAGGAGGGGGDNSSTTTGGTGGAGGGTSGVNGGASSTAGGGSGGTQSAGGTGGSGGTNTGSAGSSLQGGAGADGLSGQGSDGSMSNGGTPGGGAGGTADQNASGYAGGGGGGGGYFGGGGGSDSAAGDAGGGGGGGGSSYTSGSGSTNTAGSGSTPGNSSDGERGTAGNGGTGGGTRGSGTSGNGGAVIISYGSGNADVSTVSWAQFNVTSGTIDSANPGSGTCSNWCTSSTYNLPAPRADLSLVAYNGFLYAIGGEDSGCTSANGTGDGGICNTVYIAKLGANGEPQLWSPVSTDRSTWTYWYQDANLTSPRSTIAAVAYNNRMYLLGGKTSSGGTISIANTAQVASITATGTLGSWSSQTTLPYADYGYGAQTYNGRIYLIGGASSVGGTPLNSVYYNKINSDGTLNSWVQTSSLTGGRMTEGGDFSSVWGGYIYVSGGCSAVNASGYCTSTAGDTQLASINADGSLDTWNDNPGVSDARMGHNIVAWRNYLYEIGGCTAQDGTSGACTTTLSTINYGAINQEGDVSVISNSVPSGTSPCSGSSPYNCSLPPAGNGSGQVGQMLNATAIINGYLYVAGGCTSTSCNAASYNTAYAAISSTGTLTEPANCTADGNTLYGAWCVDSKDRITAGGFFGTRGIAAAATAVFGSRMYLIGGIDGTGNTDEIYYTTVNSDGSLNSWTAETLDTTAGATSVAYEYAFMRSNPGSAATAPANLFIFGGCSSTSYASCTGYTDAVYKCDVQSDGSIANCSTSGQLQIGTVTGASGAGLAGMGGTVYANYIYLIGGIAPGQTSGLATVRYAEIDNSNNVVAVSGGGWIESSSQLASARQLASGFGFNGYIYVMGGYNSTGVLSDIEFAKINVSDGSINTFNTSAATISPRWGLGTPVSNSYVYVIGGCQAGSAPTGCTSMQTTVDNVEIYNNDSGAPADYTTSANTYTAAASRMGASSTILNGYIYVAGGCTSSTDCTTTTSDVSYAPIDAQGNVGAWSSTSAVLPAGRVWGKLEAAGGTLYYIGGQDNTGAAQTTIYYATPSSGNISSWGTATNGLPQARTNFGAAVWNNRIYVVGGVNATAGTASFSTPGTHTFTVPSNISAISVKAWGAGGGGGGGGGRGTGGTGGGGGYASTTLSVTAGETLDVYVGGGGGGGTGRTNNGGNGGGGGGYSSITRSTTQLLIAAGGAGGGGGSGSNYVNGGAGGAGGGTSGIAGSASNGAGGGGAGTSSGGGAGGTGGSNSGSAGSSLAGGAGADGINAQGTDGSGGGGGTEGGGAGGAGAVSSNYAGAGGGGAGYYGGGGGSGSTYSFFGGLSGAGGGGGGSSYTSGTSPINTSGSGQTPGNSGDPDVGSAGQGGNAGGRGSTGSTGTSGKVVISYGSTASLYISPQLNTGGDITSAWAASSNSINAPRSGLTAVAYANNLYIFGGSDGSNYYSDSQFAQINTTDGSIGSWSYSTSLPQPLAQADGFAANGYVYLMGGRSDAGTCLPVTLVAPISANTTIASGNRPTGVGTWYETNQKYSGNRYGAAVAYSDGKAYIMGGACTNGGSSLAYASPAMQQTTLLTQPQVAEYSIMIDTDTDVYPNYWLLNGLDNSIGAEWQLKYQSMTNTTTYCTSPAMTTWGQTTDFGNVTLGTPGVYTPLDGSGNSTNCARFFYFDVTIDSSHAFGYPDDVTRGPTITDLTLQFTADPSKRLMHGRTFTGGLQQPDDTPYYTH